MFATVQYFGTLTSSSLTRQWQSALKNQLCNVIRQIQTSSVTEKSQSGRFTISIKHDKPLTYEQAHKPSDIAGRKGWNSMNTCKR